MSNLNIIQVDSSLLGTSDREELTFNFNKLNRVLNGIKRNSDDDYILFLPNGVEIDLDALKNRYPDYLNYIAPFDLIQFDLRDCLNNFQKEVPLVYKPEYGSEDFNLTLNGLAIKLTLWNKVHKYMEKMVKIPHVFPLSIVPLLYSNSVGILLDSSEVKSEEIHIPKKLSDLDMSNIRNLLYPIVKNDFLIIEAIQEYLDDGL